MLLPGAEKLRLQEQRMQGTRACCCFCCLARQLGSRSPHKIRKFDVVQQAKLKWRRGRQRQRQRQRRGGNAITNACCREWHEERLPVQACGWRVAVGGCVAATLLGLSTCDAAAIKIHSCRGARRERQKGRRASRQARGAGRRGHVKWPGCVRAAL